MVNENYRPGIGCNAIAFGQQLAQVFFVGLTIGMQRTVVPVLAVSEFGVPAASFSLLTAFVVSFGIVKGTMNLLSGRLSDRLGRKKVLILGWIVALPIPFVFLFAPSWNWIVAGNVLLGINQGFAWSMTVTSKMDIVRAGQRGLATGLNEFAGYTGVAIAGLATSFLALQFDPRSALFAFGMSVAVIALLSAIFFYRETLPWARQAHASAPAVSANPSGHTRTVLSDTPGGFELFAYVTIRHRTLAALTQAGCVEKFVDALVWVFFPLFLTSQGMNLADVAWVVSVYGITWGASQLWTGPLSDRIGRKWPIVIGMLVCAFSVAAFPLVQGFAAWSWCAFLAGVGMALLYPTLIAAVGDVSDPLWRGTSLGVYRFWRDLGYGIGALALGVTADLTDSLSGGFWFVAAAMFLSTVWLIVAMDETRPPGISGDRGTDKE